MDMQGDSEEELKVMNELWKVVRLYTNFFQPVMKLVKKERVGSRIRKQYDKAKTPYQRVLESEYVSEEVKEKLKEEYGKLNPVKLKEEIVRLQNKLFKMLSMKSRAKENFHIENPVRQ